ncbi:MAG: NAD(P)-dependent oxidoreductase [Candidatus Melainabacteria bacterium]|nr:NAD(P)-dependent oxidoreductase [Candidatus Melainabacteria bacterium]
MPKPTAIVTGVPGWLGSRLAEKLLESGREVRVAKFKNAPYESKGKSNLKVFECDVTEPETLLPVFQDALGATVFHCAGIIHPTKGRKQFYDVNVEGTRNLLDAASAAGVRRFIHVSSNSPIGCNEDRDQLFDEKTAYNPYMHYGQSKKEAEDLVNAAGKSGSFDIVIIRPPWFYGPGQPERQNLFFTMIKKGKAPIVGSGENLRSMAYVDNICQALELCESVDGAKGQTYWIADERPYSMNEIVDTIEKVMERDFKMQVAHKRMRLPDMASDIAYMVDNCLQSAGLYHQKFHVLSEMNKNIACKIDKAKKELGYKPEVSLEEGMRRSIAWVLENGGKI